MSLALSRLLPAAVAALSSSLACWPVVAGETPAGASAPAAAQPAGVPLQPSWKTGDVLAYRERTCRHDVKAGVAGERRCKDSVVHILVLGVGEDGQSSVHRWKTDDTASDFGASMGVPASRLDTAALQRVLDTPLDLGLDADGTPVALADVPAMRRAMRDLVAALSPATDDPKEQQAQALRRRVFEEMLGDDAKLTALSLKEPAILYGSFGATYEPGSTASVDEELPTPFAPQPLPAVMQVRVGQVDPATHEIEIESTEQLDPSRLADVVASLMRRLAALGPGGAASAAEVPDAKSFQLQLRRHTTVRVDVRDRWPVHVEWTQAVTLGPSGRVESIEFTRLR